MKRIWTPPTEKIDIYNYRINIIILFITVLGFIVAYFGLKYTFNSFIIGQKQLSIELKQLNSEAEISLYFKRLSATSTLEVGPEVMDPTTISIEAYNKGDFNSSMWTAGINFCRKVNVLNFPVTWVDLDNNFFIYESKEKIIKEKMIFSNKIDSIGNFIVILPGRNYFKNEKLPIAIISTYGERAKTINKVVFLKYTSENKLDFVYEDFLVNDGKILTDMAGCFNVE